MFPTKRIHAREVPAFTLIELLCVMAIIAILVSLMMGPVAKALRKARNLENGFDVPAHVERLENGMRKFAAAHPKFRCDSLEQLIEQSNCGGATKRWLLANDAGFSPFGNFTPGNMGVLVVTPRGSTNLLAVLTVDDLTVTPQ